MAATVMFLTLAYFSYCLFTKSNGQPTPQKRKRNVVYRICGVAIVACIVLVGVFKLFLAATPIADLDPAFWLESLALWAFGISWFVKGETLWKDVDPNGA